MAAIVHSSGFAIAEALDADADAGQVDGVGFLALDLAERPAPTS